MNYKEIMKVINKKFPFENYILENSFGDSYQTLFSIVNKYISPGSNALDFGSGPCDKASILSLLGHNCSAIDDLQDEWQKEPGVSESIIMYAEDMNIDLFHALSDINKSKNLPFDLIMLNDVIEHLHESPRELLHELLDMLSDDGILYITVPNAGNIRKRIDLLRGKTNMPPFSIYYFYPNLWRGHIREYVYSDLVQLSEYLDLEILMLSGVDHMLQKVPSKLLPFYKFITAFFPGWKDSWVLVAKKSLI